MTALSWLIVDLDGLPAGQAWLSESERAFARNLDVPKRRQDWMLGRYAAKKAPVCKTKADCKITGCVCGFLIWSSLW